jgi:DNA-directed RNA polymerase subunit RPC12/RpoP
VKLKRRFARGAIAALAFGIVCLCIPPVFDLHESAEYFIYAGGALILISLLIKTLLLKCPTCGYRGAIPQWSKSGSIHCPKCGEPFEYDR